MGKSKGQVIKEAGLPILLLVPTVPHPTAFSIGRKAHRPGRASQSKARESSNAPETFGFLGLKADAGCPHDCYPACQG